MLPNSVDIPIWKRRAAKRIVQTNRFSALALIMVDGMLVKVLGDIQGQVPVIHVVGGRLIGYEHDTLVANTIARRSLRASCKSVRSVAADLK